MFLHVQGRIEIDIPVMGWSHPIFGESAMVMTPLALRILHQQENPIFDGQKPWFPVIFPTQPIHWYLVGGLEHEFYLPQ